MRYLCLKRNTNLVKSILEGKREREKERERERERKREGERERERRRELSRSGLSRRINRL